MKTSQRSSKNLLTSFFAVAAHVLVVIGCVTSNHSLAQPIPGSFDRAPIVGFNNSTGIITDIAPIRGASNVVNQVGASAIDASGRIVMAGYCYNNYPINRYDACIVRLLSNGQPDNGFGTLGARVIATGSGDTFFATLQIDSNGRYLIGGECQPNSNAGRMPCVFRFDPATNSLDSSYGVNTGLFGRQGYTPITTALSASSPARTALLSYGWSVSVYPCYRSTPTIAALLSACVSRVNDSGGVDANFGVNATAAIGLPDEEFSSTGISVDASSRIYISASCGNRPGKVNRGCVARLNENGSLDTSFGATSATPGVVSLPITDTATDIGYVRKVLVQPDSKIVAVGYCTYLGATSGRFCAARLNQNGTLDSSFGQGGKTYLANMLVASSTSDAVLQPDGKIIIAGACPADTSGSISLPCIARLDANGKLDPGFDSDNGVANGSFAFTNLGNYAAMNSLALQTDGKLVLSGYCSVPVAGSSSITTICAARLNGGPLPDTTCSMDVDGDGRTYATIDGIILTRVMMGMSGDAVTNGIQFTRDSMRTTWPQIRQHLTGVCQMAITQP